MFVFFITVSYRFHLSPIYPVGDNLNSLPSDDAPPYLQGRPVALITASDPITFPAMVDSVYELRAWLAPTRVVVKRADFGADLALVNEDTNRRLTRLVKELLAFKQTE